MNCLLLVLMNRTIHVLILSLLFLFTFGNPNLIHAQQPAPEFTLNDLSGNQVSLSDFKGQLVLLDFWATWCVPCRKSLPELAELDQKYRGDGVVVLGLAIDNPESFDNAYIAKFVQKYNVKYQILRAHKEVVDQYLGTEEPSVPTAYLINEQGSIVEKHEGYIPGKLEKMIVTHLK